MEKSARRQHAVLVLVPMAAMGILCLAMGGCGDAQVSKADEQQLKQGPSATPPPQALELMRKMNESGGGRPGGGGPPPRR